jgi:hypothetical protein
MGQSIDLFRKSGLSLPNTPNINSGSLASSSDEDGDLGVRALLGAGEFSYLLGQANEKIANASNPFDPLKTLSPSDLESTLSTHLPGVTQTSERISDMYNGILSLLGSPDILEKLKITPEQLHTIQKEFRNNTEVLERLRTALLATSSTAASHAATAGGIIDPAEKAALDQRTGELHNHIRRVHFSALMSISDILDSDQFSGLFAALKANKESAATAPEASEEVAAADIDSTVQSA